MRDVKMGFIAKISRNDNFGVIRETSTGTEYLFYLDELSKRQAQNLMITNQVTFTRDNDYEQFVARQVEAVSKFFGQVG